MLTLFRRLFRTLSPFDEAVFVGLKSVLSPEMTARLARQMTQIARVVRMKPTVSFYSRRYQRGASFADTLDSSRFWDADSLFPARREIDVAEMTLELPAEAGRFAVRSLSVDGHICSLVVRPWPGALVWRDGWHAVAVNPADDPAIPSESRRPAELRPIEPKQLTGWVGEFCRGHGGTNLRAPNPLYPVEKLAQEIRSKLPADYCEFARQVGAVNFPHDIELWSADRVYEVQLDDADYYLLGMMADVGWFAVRRLDQSGHVFFLDDNGDVEDSGPSFREAIEKRLAD